MTQAILSVPARKNGSVREHLTAEQEHFLITQVQERTRLLKRKKNFLTPEEQRIRIRGERAFNLLLEDYQGVIRRLMHRYSFLNRISHDEMYQIALVAFEKAVNSYNPNCSQKQRKFSSWVFLKICSKYISLYRTELCHSRRIRVAYDALRSKANPNEYQPSETILEVNMREILMDEIESTLTRCEADILKQFYFQKKKRKEIADQLGCSTLYIDTRRRRSLKQLSTNLRLRGLAETCLA
jgi:RNA polymerase sigma factor (sigma-70 family)